MTTSKAGKAVKIKNNYRVVSYDRISQAITNSVSTIGQYHDGASQ
ncbi:hypothetical protein PLUTE_a4874 [Pseudoalteromonas luteoviolacea DSM 6061]|nr:hypothetical protein [Pseudoalteromonas luteoviolacea DSM 6061]